MSLVDALWRLVWALPLVLLTGAGVVLLLRRVAALDQRSPGSAARMRLLETLTLSEQTRVYLIEVDRQSLLLVESSQTATLEAVSSSTGAHGLPLKARLPASRARVFFRTPAK